MWTDDIDTLRETITQLERGRRAMMEAPAEWFDWGYPGVPACGTPGCCWGFMKSTDTRLQPQGFMAWSTGKIPWAWAGHVFRMITDVAGDKDRLYRKARQFHHSLMAGPAHARNLANRRMLKLIDRLRRRLAILEVEQGHWRDVPVGQARERVLEGVGV